MPQITIVGLGPGSVGDLTRDAWQILSDAPEIWLRTLHHPVVPDLPNQSALHAFDEVYERADTFQDVYAEICSRVVALGRRPHGVVYAVPGHPMVGESTVTRIVEAARSEALPVHIVSGLSFVEPSLTAIGLDGLDGLQVADALDIVALHHPPLNPDTPSLIAQVYSRAVASELKLVLMNQYPDEHPTVLLDGAGTGRERILELPLYEIDRYDATPLTSLYVSPMPVVSGFEGFQETIARLRSPEGCPWDREQTHQSLRTNLLEESYEVLAAIDENDPDSLREELGDLLLQVVLHAQIAVEEGEFRMAEVIAQIDAKLKRRHPHVWDNLEVEGVDEVISNWEVIKRRERAEKGTPERSLLGGIPSALPALAQAAAYTDRAGRIGFDRVWARGIWVTLGQPERERLAGLLDVLSEAIADQPAPEAQVQLLGDILLVIADWARSVEIDPESALREANTRFARRFAVVESASRVSGESLEKIPVELIRKLWREAGLL